MLPSGKESRIATQEVAIDRPCAMINSRDAYSCLALQLAESQAALLRDQARASVRAQMDVEDRQRRLLESAKEDQKQAAQKEVFEALAKLSKEEEQQEAAEKARKASANVARQEMLRQQQDERSDNSDHDDADGATGDARDIFQSTATREPAAQVTDDADADTAAALPPPRSRGGGVKISFSARAFPTPLRESKRKEEEDWLARNYLKLQEQQKKKVSADGQPTTPFAEKDPAWLKSKGDDFFKLADYLSAINAYTAALNADPASVPCLLNRAACFLAKGFAAKCADDCTAALQHLATVKDEQPSTAEKVKQQTIRAVARRMAALAMDGQYAAALHDAELAAELAPSLESAVQQLTSLTRAQDLKQQADKAAAAETSQSHALALYDQALEAEPKYALALLNRSALHLKAGRYGNAAADCRTVLELLAGDAAGLDSDQQLAPVPKRGSQLYQQVLQRAEARLAESSKHLDEQQQQTEIEHAQPHQDTPA